MSGIFSFSKHEALGMRHYSKREASPPGQHPTDRSRNHNLKNKVGWRFPALHTHQIVYSKSVQPLAGQSDLNKVALEKKEKGN